MHEIKCNELPESNCLISEFSPTSSNSPLSHDINFLQKSIYAYIANLSWGLILI